MARIAGPFRATRDDEHSRRVTRACQAVRRYNRLLGGQVGSAPFDLTIRRQRGPPVRRRGSSRKLLGVAAVAIAAVAFGGCDWTMFGFDAALTHSSFDKAINGANISTVKQLFTYATASSDNLGSPVESNGVVYVNDTSGLEAFDANGVSNCSGTPNQCSPLWISSTGSSPAATPAVANGVVYTDDVSSLSAFDANGVTNCSGTPTTCQPLWTASLSPGGFSSVLVVDGVVYVGGNVPGSPQGRVEAFDANGTTNCSGTPKTCQPLWTSSSNVGFSSPAVANGVLYAQGQDAKLYAFSANGTTSCSGTPTTCSPMWVAAMGTMGASQVTPGSPAVANGIVYGQSPLSATLYAFDANGVTNCSGTPTTCSPLWTASPGGYLNGPPSPAVANGIVYTDSGAVFDANGNTNCSGTPKTCRPLWSYNVGDVVSSPSIANGLVFISQFQYGTTGVLAFDANGVTNCSGAPKTCTPLWTGPTNEPAIGDPAIANGKVYDTDYRPPIPFGPPIQGDLYAWVLPPPTTAISVPSDNATVSGVQTLDASASPGVTQVQYELTGGTLNHSVIGTAVPTYVGWLLVWTSTTVPNGTYTLQTVASYGGEVSGTSPPITITVSN